MQVSYPVISIKLDNQRNLAFSFVPAYTWIKRRNHSFLTRIKAVDHCNSFYLGAL